MMVDIQPPRTFLFMKSQELDKTICLPFASNQTHASPYGKTINQRFKAKALIYVLLDAILSTVILRSLYSDCVNLPSENSLFFSRDGHYELSPSSIYCAADF